MGGNKDIWLGLSLSYLHEDGVIQRDAKPGRPAGTPPPVCSFYLRTYAHLDLGTGAAAACKYVKLG